MFSAIWRRVRRRYQERKDDKSGESVKPNASSTMRGGDDEDGIHYSGDTSVMPIFVCCGARYINKQFEQGPHIIDSHESVNKSRRLQASHVEGNGSKGMVERTQSCPGAIRTRSFQSGVETTAMAAIEEGRGGREKKRSANVDYRITTDV